ncbi:MAG: hypothetical protein HQL76_13160, partial [Magnetococcales bacterium]|nr:hypothetical protein [Magnetococcales bacterium]
MMQSSINSFLKKWLYQDVKPVWAFRYLEALQEGDVRVKKLAIVGFLARVEVEESSGLSLIEDRTQGERRAVYEEIHKLFKGEEEFRKKIAGESWTMAILEKKEELLRDLAQARRKRTTVLWGGAGTVAALVFGLTVFLFLVDGSAPPAVVEPETVAMPERGVVVPMGAVKSEPNKGGGVVASSKPIENRGPSSTQAVAAIAASPKTTEHPGGGNSGAPVKDSVAVVARTNDAAVPAAKEGSTGDAPDGAEELFVAEMDRSRPAAVVAEQESKLFPEKEAKLAAEKEAKLAAEKEAKLAAEKEAKLATEKEAKLATEKEAKLAAE